MNTYLYLIITGLEFDHPLHPGYLPEIPDGATAVTTSKFVRHNKVVRTKFDITKACDDALKQHILAAFQNDYV